MIYTHWTTIMFEDIIKVLANRLLFQQKRPCKSDEKCIISIRPTRSILMLGQLLD